MANMSVALALFLVYQPTTDALSIVIARSDIERVTISVGFRLVQLQVPPRYLHPSLLSF